MRPIPHGGNPASARRRYGLGDAPLIDFSTGLNPLGPPSGVIEAARRALGDPSKYPEPGVPRLTERLAEHHGVEVDRVIVGAGSTELIGLIAQSLREVLALHAYERGNPAMPVSHLAEPTYGEYRRLSRLNELRCETWSGHVLSWRQETYPTEAAGVFWTGHPDNPTGRVWDREPLLRLIDDSLGLLTVVDEAYLPLRADEPDRTVVTEAAARENLLVLRSFTPLFATPSLRLGYAVASSDLIVRLRQYQDPWTVTTVAEAAALAGLNDTDFLERTRQTLAMESERVAARLWELPGLRPVQPDRVRPTDAPAVSGFQLVSLTETSWTAPQVHEALARRGFLVRECSDFAGLEVGSLLTGHDQLVATQGHLRIGVRRPHENDALLAALDEVLSSEPNR